MIVASSKAIWVLGGVLAMAPLGVIGYFVYAARKTDLVITPDELRVKGNVFYSRSIPRTSVIADGVRPVDLTEEDALRPRWRTNGVGLPGYLSGWFKLKSGERALLFVTDKRRLIYIPTTEGYSVLVSVHDPESVVAELRTPPNAGDRSTMRDS